MEINEVFNKIKIGSDKVVNRVVDSTKNMSVVSDLKKQIKEATDEKDKMINFMGMEVYELYKKGEVQLEQISSFYSKVDDLLVKIDELEVKLEDNKKEMSKPECPSCGYKIMKITNFCPECGASLEAIKQKEAEKEAAREAEREAKKAAKEAAEAERKAAKEAAEAEKKAAKEAAETSDAVNNIAQPLVNGESVENIQPATENQEKAKVNIEKGNSIETESNNGQNATDVPMAETNATDSVYKVQNVNFIQADDSVVENTNLVQENTTVERTNLEEKVNMAEEMHPVESFSEVDNVNNNENKRTCICGAVVDNDRVICPICGRVLSDNN